MWDNLFDSQIIDQCIYPHMLTSGEVQRPEDVALCISSLAESISYSPSVETPWTVNAVAAGRRRERELGGKADDITVIVA